MNKNTDKFLSDQAAFEAESRKSKIVVGPGESQAKQDADTLRIIGVSIGHGHAILEDREKLQAIADRLESAACDAGAGAMGFTPAADHQARWLKQVSDLQAENERLRRELDLAKTERNLRAEKAEARVKELETEKRNVYAQWGKVAATVVAWKPVVDAAVKWVKAHQGYSATDMGDIRSAVHALAAQEPKAETAEKESAYGALRRTADAKPPECAITEEDVRGLGELLQVLYARGLQGWGPDVQRILAHARLARGEK
jgi:hypothetical protein